MELFDREFRRLTKELVTRQIAEAPGDVSDDYALGFASCWALAAASTWTATYSPEVIAAWIAGVIPIAQANVEAIIDEVDDARAFRHFVNGDES